MEEDGFRGKSYFYYNAVVRRGRKIVTDTTRECLIEFLNEFQNEIKEPIADYGGNERQDFKFVKKTLASGGIVDCSPLDYSTGVDLLKPIKGRKYNTGICMDLLEHVSNPFIVGENITNSLRKGALLFVTAPFVWGTHNCPNDYFRFTAEGLKVIFPKLEWLRIDIRVDDCWKNLKKFRKDDKIVKFFRVVGVFKKI